MPLNIDAKKFVAGDTVEVHFKHGWWIGKIIKVVRSRYKVSFQFTSEKEMFESDELRLHQHWIVDSGWIYSQITLRLGSKGEMVEVSKTEAGLKDSFYCATVISTHKNEKYSVKYETLTTDSGRGKLVETVHESQLRSIPLKINADKYVEGDIVDVYFNHGWWIGRIVKVVQSNYKVLFQFTSEKEMFELQDLRLHQNWFADSAWVYAKN